MLIPLRLGLALLLGATGLAITTDQVPHDRSGWVVPPVVPDPATAALAPVSRPTTRCREVYRPSRRRAELVAAVMRLPAGQATSGGRRVYHVTHRCGQPGCRDRMTGAWTAPALEAGGRPMVF